MFQFSLNKSNFRLFGVFSRNIDSLSYLVLVLVKMLELGTSSTCSNYGMSNG